jgi:hypothetical protein
MTPKAKAIDLFNDYYSYLKANLIYDEEAREDAKQCALIAVEEMLGEYQSMSDLESTLVVEGQVLSVIDKLVHWMEVKQEINKL